MDKYLIALDMDGTLLNNDKEISFRTKEYLTKLAKDGHIVMIASGRPYRAIQRYYESMELTTPIICYNGSYTFSPVDNAFHTVRETFPKEIVKDIYNRIQPYLFSIMCESDKDIWINKRDGFLADFFYYDEMHIHQGDMNEILNEDPLTMIVRIPDNFDKKD